MFQRVLFTVLLLAGSGCEDDTTVKPDMLREHTHDADGGSNPAPAADSGSDAARTTQPESGRTEDDAGQDNIARGNAEPDDNPKIDNQAYAEVIQELNRFGLDLGRRYAEDDQLTEKNSVYSPLSASLALAMTYSGARGTTADQFKQVLSGGIEADVFHAGMNRLARQLASRAQDEEDFAGNSHKVELNISDAVFVESTLGLKTAFLDQLSRNYDNGVFLEDFAQNAEQARVHINDWVAGRTHDKIKDLLSPGTVHSGTRLVLVNALYFYANWARPFEAAVTSDADFHTLASHTVSVPTMHNLLDLPYQERNDFVAVDLPYAGNHLAMFIVVPNQGRFEDVRKAVSEKWLKEAISVRATKSVSLALPKFTMTVGPFDLTKSLKAMGIIAAFSSDADFSGITDQGALAIDLVVQKAFIGVDERGTEAAAATAVGLSGDAAPTDFVVLNVDRPFLFFIHDDNGIVLFSGHVVDPSKSE